MKLEDIYNKYPFLYELNGELYQLGSGTFKIGASLNAEEQYILYKKEIERIGRNNIRPFRLDYAEVKDLVHTFRRIMNYCERENADTDYAETKKDLLTYVESLSIELKERLIEQLEDYCNVFWYYRRYM